MAKGEIKTRPTNASAGEFIEAVEDEKQQTDAHWIAEMMERISGFKPVMWGPSIIGFGNYHYKYDSGHEGDMCRIGFSPRKGQTVFYIANGFAGYAELMERLGKYKTGKSCLYIKRLTDVDLSVLEQLCVESLKWMAEKYPDRSFKG